MQLADDLPLIGMFGLTFGSAILVRGPSRKPARLPSLDPVAEPLDQFADQPVVQRRIRNAGTAWHSSADTTVAIPGTARKPDGRFSGQPEVAIDPSLKLNGNCGGDSAPRIARQAEQHDHQVVEQLLGLA
jgi:hypothetical protein